jgi:hypothetical protein
MTSVRVTLASDPGTRGWPNEDFAAVSPGAAVLLDGCTTFPPGTETGCVHGVAWFARSLGTALLAAVTAEPPVPLAQCLAVAITEVAGRHEHTCDLSSPGTPASTVTAIRAVPGRFELLALSDSSIAAEFTDGRPPLVISDTHPAARAEPAAAGAAHTQILPRDGLRGIALLSDGAARITDKYRLLGWPAALAVIRDQGPAELIRQVRDAEDDDPECTRWPRFKPRDDATVTYWDLSRSDAPGDDRSAPFAGP